MIASLEDKNKWELLEICQIQQEEYKKLLAELKAARADVETLESNLRVITYETARIIQGNCYDGHGAGNQRLLDYAKKLEAKS